MNGQNVNGPWNGHGADWERPAPGDPEAAYYTDDATGRAKQPGGWYDDPANASANNRPFGGPWGSQSGYGGIPDSDPRQPDYNAMNAGPWNGPRGYPYRRRGWNWLLIVGLVLLALLLLRPLAIAGFVLGFVFFVPLALLAVGLGIVGMVLRLLFGWRRYPRGWGWYGPWGPWGYWAAPPLFWMGSRRWRHHPWRGWWGWW
jgi:hypothetical protein